MKERTLQIAVEQKIFIIRGLKVILDKDLSHLYRVDPRALRQQVKRNKERFPHDFMLQLTEEEMKSMVSQIVTPPRKYFGGHLPYAFTEQGVAMLSGVLHSKRAVQVNIAIMRAFVRMREILLTHKNLAAKITALELKHKNHDMKFSEYDKHIAVIFEAIKKLMAPPPEKPRRMIGFKQE